jgi:hypothetical protein
LSAENVGAVAVSSTIKAAQTTPKEAFGERLLIEVRLMVLRAPA